MAVKTIRSFLLVLLVEKSVERLLFAISKDNGLLLEEKKKRRIKGIKQLLEKYTIKEQYHSEQMEKARRKRIVLSAELIKLEGETNETV